MRVQVGKTICAREPVTPMPTRVLPTPSRTQRVSRHSRRRNSRLFLLWKPPTRKLHPTTCDGPLAANKLHLRSTTLPPPPEHTHTHTHTHTHIHIAHSLTHFRPLPPMNDLPVRADTPKHSARRSIDRAACGRHLTTQAACASQHHCLTLFTHTTYTHTRTHTHTHTHTHIARFTG